MLVVIVMAIVMAIVIVIVDAIQKKRANSKTEVME
jgi:hypothetical protein